MEITLAELEEVLDKKLAKMASKEDLDKRFSAFGRDMDQKMDDRFLTFGRDMDQKFEKQTEKLTKEFKAYTDEQTGILAAYIAETIAIPLEQLKKETVK